MSNDIVTAPCQWGGGNDYLACSVCGLEYDYRVTPKPPCGAAAEITRLRAELASPSRAGGGVEMTPDMIAAAESYLILRSLNGLANLPAQFNWHEFYAAIIAAAPRSALLADPAGESAPKDTRPDHCRFRLQDEGKPYPRSSCQACSKGIASGLGKECSVTAGTVDDLRNKLHTTETAIAAEKQARETAEALHRHDRQMWDATRRRAETAERELAVMTSDRAADTEMLIAAEATITRLTAERETLRREISRIVGEIERQNVVNDRYAEQSSKPLSDPRETWLICNSHIKDHARELRAALEASATDEVKP